jgi:hypothetical protein
VAEDQGGFLGAMPTEIEETGEFRNEVDYLSETAQSTSSSASWRNSV